MEQQKLAALTFDDGPTIGITDQVLDILEENDVKASFFLIGQQITEETEYLVKRAYDMGCSIENHSLTHASMPTLSPEEIKAEIDETTRRIEKITGEKPEFFRPPFIDYDQKMYDAIDLPFICAYGCEDWEPSVSAGERIKRVLEAARPGYMVLLHDMKDNEQTVEAIKTIIPELKKRNYPGILLIVSNPVDILTLAALRLSGFAENRVFGSGTVLDTARLKTELGRHLSVDSRSVHSFIIGEHGDSEIAAWSSTNISGVSPADIAALMIYLERK